MFYRLHFFFFFELIRSGKYQSFNLTWCSLTLRCLVCIACNSLHKHIEHRTTHEPRERAFLAFVDFGREPPPSAPHSFLPYPRINTHIHTYTHRAESNPYSPDHSFHKHFLFFFSLFSPSGCIHILCSSSFMSRAITFFFLKLLYSKYVFHHTGQGPCLVFHSDSDGFVFFQWDLYVIK